MFELLKETLEFVDELRLSAYVAEKNIKDGFEELRHRNKKMSDEQLTQLEKWATEK